MNIAQHPQRVIFLLASIALIALPHVSHLPLAIIAFFYTVLAWRWLGVWRPQWLPSRWTVFVLTLIGLAVLYAQHLGVLGRDGGTCLFMTALGLKLLEIKSARDFYLIIYLAFVVAASQFLYEQSLWMAAYTLFVCCVLLATLVSINSNTAHTKAALGNASLIVVQAIPIAIVVFIVFPRLEAPHWMLFNEAHKARAGLSDTLQPGSISELSMSEALVFRAKFTGPLPPPAQRYWRGPVLSHTDGIKWTPIRDTRFGAYRDKPRFAGTAYAYTLLMEAQDKPWVFALDMPQSYSDSVRQNAYYQLITTGNPDQRAEYRVTSYPQYNTGFITRTEYKDNTELPADPSPKIQQLVTQLHGFDAPPEQFVKQLLNHFRTENFHYTLSPPLMEANPIETFLFTSRQGFCSHYAAAFVYLMRVAHIPARIVTGYQGGEINPIGSFLEVRQADAHAWAEVWIEQQGWVRVDPTAAIAPQRVEQSINVAQLVPSGVIQYLPSDATASWLKQARQLWGNIDYNWQRWVINYDNKNQSSLLSALGIFDIKTMAYWLAAVIASITAVLSALLLYQKPRAPDPTLRAYQRYCKKLAKRGFIKARNEGAQDFAHRIKPQLPAQAAHIDRITQLFIKLHYGKHSTPADLQLLKQWVAKFRV